MPAGGPARRVDRDGLGLKSAVVAAVFVLLLAIGWTISGFVSGLLSAVPIGIGVGVAVFFAGDRGRCLRGGGSRERGNDREELET